MISLIGMGLLPDDRKAEGIIADLSVRENIILAMQAKRGMFKLLPMSRQNEIADKYIELLQIKTASRETLIGQLSGGNQQKVVFAKALLTEPSIWFCDEPTQAVDVATRQEIHRLLKEEAKKGKAVLYVSSDLTELLEVADEVAVMACGRVRKTFENKDLKPTDVLACCYEAEREENDR